MSVATFITIIVVGFIGLTGYLYHLRDRRVMTGVLVSLALFLAGAAFAFSQVSNLNFMPDTAYFLIWGLIPQGVAFIPLAAFLRPRQRCPQCHAYTHMRAQHCHRCGYAYKPSAPTMPSLRRQAVELWRNTYFYRAVLALMLVALAGGALSMALLAPAFRHEQDRQATQMAGLRIGYVWPTSTPVDFIEVVVAATSIPWGDRIEADMLDTVMYPVNNQPSGAYEDSNSVIGSYAARDIEAGEVIFSDELLLENPTSNDRTVLPLGELQIGQTYMGILDGNRWMEEWSLSGQVGQQLSLNVSVIHDPVPILLVFQMPSEEPLMGEGRVINKTLTRIVTLPETGNYRVMLIRAGAGMLPRWDWYALTLLTGAVVIETTPQVPLIPTVMP